MSAVSVSRARVMAVLAGGSRPRDAMSMRGRVRRAKGLGPRTIEVVASTSKRASDGMVILESAWPDNISRIQRGAQRVPRVLSSHTPVLADGGQPVIGRIPVESIRLEPGAGLVHAIEFAPESVHRDGERFFEAFEQGYLDSVSIAWSDEQLAPKREWQDPNTPEIASLVWQETSVVAFGADPGAVKRARSAGHHDVAALLESHARRDATDHEAQRVARLLGNLRTKATPTSAVDRALAAMEAATKRLNPGDAMRRQLAALTAATARLDELHLDDLRRRVQDMR